MKKITCALLLGVLLLAMPACGASGKSNNSAGMAIDTMASAQHSVFGASEYEYYSENAKPEEMDAPTSGETAEVSEGQTSNRKLIKNVNMTVETKEYDQLLATLEAQINSLGGYIESMDAYNGSSYSSYRDNRNAYLRIRIPENQLDTFLNTVTDNSNVVNRSDSVEDVTLQYVDLESHRNALRTEQERLLELMEQAETIEDIITIEERLSNVRYQLESMESQLRTLENQVSYSTVYLDISEVKELTPVTEETTWERITGGFMESIQDIGSGILEAAIRFVIYLPYFVLWALIIVIVILIVRQIHKNAKRRPKKKQQEQPKWQNPANWQDAPRFSNPPTTENSNKSTENGEKNEQ